MRAHWPTVIITVLLVAAATAAMLLLRDVLVEAPATVFPLILFIVIGGAMVIAWVRRRGLDER